MKQLFNNNASGTLSASVDDLAVTLVLQAGEGALFGSPSATTYELATLTDDGVVEIVKITGRTTDTLTVVRGQEGTTAQAWGSGTTIEGRITKGTLEHLVQNVAEGTNAVAIGEGATADGERATVMGNYAYGMQEDDVLVGYKAISTVESGWSSLIDKAQGDWIRVDVGGTDYLFRQLLESGTTGVSLPTFGTDLGELTEDGSVVWQCYGADSGGGSAASALGFMSTALGNQAVAIGRHAHAVSGVAIGNTSGAIAQSVSVGRESLANVKDSVCLGRNSAVRIAMPEWTPDTEFHSGDVIKNTAGTHVFRVDNWSSVEQVYLSGGVEPTWDTDLNSYTTDTTGFPFNNLSWQCIAPIGDYALSETIGGVAMGGYATTEQGGVALGYEAHGVYNGIGIGQAAIAVMGIGIGNTAYANGGVAIGKSAYAASDVEWNTGALALGDYARAYGEYSSLAIGEGAEAANIHTIAIGPYSMARVENSHVLGGLSIAPKSDGYVEYDAVIYGSSQENYLLAKEVSLTQTAADDIIVIPIPEGALFFVSEVGLILTESDTVTGQPEISFGVTGSTEALLAQVATTKSVEGGRNKYTPLSDDGITTAITASLKVSATATALKGRFYIKGLLVEGQ
ncbi:hypothetical protein [Methylobacter marinus]|uniref:hypothetical protein n=1 Tax=Methylobacter marinus TaxID=34058 RepID=UPI000365E3D4|nr:hypothetical protein [Methylobacter marinus]